MAPGLDTMLPPHLVQMPTSQKFNLKFQNRVTAVIHFSTHQLLPCHLFWPLPLLLQFTVSHTKGTTRATELVSVPIFSIMVSWPLLMP